MTKKSIMLFAGYVLTLVVCFSLSFTDTLIEAGIDGRYVGWVIPCAVEEVPCPICSDTLSVSPSFAEYNVDRVFYPEEVDQANATEPGLKTLVGLQTETCYIRKSCRISGDAIEYSCCDGENDCVPCIGEDCICYRVEEDSVPILIPYELKIWKPSFED